MDKVTIALSLTQPYPMYYHVNISCIKISKPSQTLLRQRKGKVIAEIIWGNRSRQRAARTLIRLWDDPLKVPPCSPPLPHLSISSHRDFGQILVIDSRHVIDQKIACDRFIVAKLSLTKIPQPKIQSNSVKWFWVNWFAPWEKWFSQSS